MFLPRILLLLACELFKGADHAEASVARLDHVVDVSVACGIVWVAEGAVEILYSKEIKNIEDPAEKARVADEKKKEYNDLFCNPYNAASFGYIDDIIEPRNTRFRIIRALEQLADKKLENPWKKHDNLPL